ncbi:hypothetical protein LMG28690_03978 [Paraburkholderia caffeinilytica]|nr:hypothetical protein LMG28690_03978 [Paraburkholderia caffeinilytica]
MRAMPARRDRRGRRGSCRRLRLYGTLVIDRTTSQEDGDCRDINFDPTILPAGIRPSNDPLLAARSAAYALSYKRRTREESLHPEVHQTKSNGERS